jgi:hypothetical protein
LYSEKQTKYLNKRDFGPSRSRGSNQDWYAQNRANVKKTTKSKSGGSAKDWYAQNRESNIFFCFVFVTSCNFSSIN